MEARWRLAPPGALDWQWTVSMNWSAATHNQGRDGNMAIFKQQLLFLATTEAPFPLTWDYSEHVDMVMHVRLAFLFACLWLNVSID